MSCFGGSAERVHGYRVGGLERADDRMREVPDHDVTALPLSVKKQTATLSAG